MATFLCSPQGSISALRHYAFISQRKGGNKLKVGSDQCKTKNKKTRSAASPGAGQRADPVGDSQKAKKAKKKVFDPYCVPPNDPKKFNAGWLNPESQQAERIVAKWGRPKLMMRGGLPSSAALKKELGEDGYQEVVGGYVEMYCTYRRDLNWWRQGFIARHGQEPDWDDMPKHYQQKDLWQVKIGAW
eukprot:CAMPEP_0198206004 /NCGR_PEP_ID=MMETSP1445-20131203/9538_1 /TAXON_ID=36898 /ORGANISM="Pyramimonas sp., Strain CCMP2087" /LENGTH=186 /DNA_ID=CAMNT_0043878523 /DNA_START=351 /DNA_END=908 /DNA_ORIENTATION=+